MRIIRFLVLGLVVLVVVVAAIGQGQTQAMTYFSGSMAITCTGQTNDLQITADRNNTGTPGMEAYTLIATDGAGTVLYRFDGTIGFGTWGVTGATWNPAPAYNPITYQIISSAGNNLPEQIAFTATGTCAGLPTYAVPGCNAQIAIPATAVGGAFVGDAPVYWKPGESIGVTIPAGNTALVIGKDASAQYYKIIWNCDFVWVPVGSMGPNHDAVWNGAPLPTGVVE